MYSCRGSGCWLLLVWCAHARICALVGCLLISFTLLLLRFAPSSRLKSWCLVRKSWWESKSWTCCLSQDNILMEIVLHWLDLPRIALGFPDSFRIGIAVVVFITRTVHRRRDSKKRERVVKRRCAQRWQIKNVTVVIVNNVSLAHDVDVASAVPPSSASPGGGLGGCVKRW